MLPDYRRGNPSTSAVDRDTRRWRSPGGANVTIDFTVSDAGVGLKSVAPGSVDVMATAAGRSSALAGDGEHLHAGPQRAGHPQRIERRADDVDCAVVQSVAEQRRSGGRRRAVVPASMRLYGVYRKKLTPLEVDRCLGNDGDWITPPRLCHELEAYYQQTMDDRYRGHVERGECMYEDRDRAGHGPY